MVLLYVSNAFVFPLEANTNLYGIRDMQVLNLKGRKEGR